MHNIRAKKTKSKQNETKNSLLFSEFSFALHEVALHSWRFNDMYFFPFLSCFCHRCCLALFSRWMHRISRTLSRVISKSRMDSTQIGYQLIVHRFVFFYYVFPHLTAHRVDTPIAIIWFNYFAHAVSCVHRGQFSTAVLEQKMSSFLSFLCFYIFQRENHRVAFWAPKPFEALKT